jgi:hypothetical protein
MSFKISPEKLKDILARRLTGVTDEAKIGFPEFLKRQVQWTAFSNEQLLALIFIPPDDIERVLSLQQKNLEQFPGLFTTSKGLPVAFRFERTRFAVVRDCSIENLYSFFLGEDSSIIVVNHTQTVQTKEIGLVKYNVPLGYFIGFGNQLSQENAYEILEELIVYSLKIWREPREKQ